MNAGLAGESIEVETVGRYIRPLLDKKNIMKLIQKQVLLACNEDVRSFVAIM